RGDLEEASPTQIMPLEVGSEMPFWAEVLSQITDMLKDHAQQADSVAISGPNHLVVTFRKSYDLQRQFCEKPSNLSRLAKTATALAGRPIRVRQKSVETPAEAAPVAKELAARRAEENKRRAELANDPLVRKALDVFGGSMIAE